MEQNINNTEQGLMNEVAKLRQRVAELEDAQNQQIMGITPGEHEENQELYRSLVDEGFDGIFVQKSDRIIFTNRRLNEMLGYEEGELLGKKHWVVYHPEDQGLTRQRARDRMLGEKVISKYEVRLQRKNKSWFYGGINAKVINLNHEPGIQVWIRDITERKQAEKALKESESLLNTMFNSITDPIHIVDRDFRVVLANKYLLDLKGYTQEEIKGKHCYDVYQGLSSLCDGCGVNETFKAGKPFVTERTLPLEDGTVHYFEVSSFPMFDSKGNLYQAIELTRDITDEKIMKKSLFESEGKYRTLFEDSIDAIFITKREGEFIDANPSFLKLFGYNLEEITKISVRDFYANPDDRGRYKKEIEKNGSVTGFSVKLVKKDGEEIDCLITASVRRDDNGAVIGYQGVIRDITEKKRAEEEKEQLESQLLHAQKMEAIGTLSGGIAHDFNNILQAISGYTQILMMGKEPDNPDYKKLKAIEKSAFRASDLTSQLLIFSRKVETKLRPVDLNQELMQVAEMLGHTIPKMIAIELNLGKDIEIINADKTQIEQIIMNLAINARDAMPDGGKVIFETMNVSIDEGYMNTHLGAVPGNYVLLSVSDTGHGIDKESVEHIFEPFYTTKERGKGTGLGLAMVYGIVKSHNGYIMCYSEEGEGTTFKIYFPVMEIETGGLQHKERIMDIKGGNETILIVDDEENLREIGMEMLTKVGYTTLTAPDGEGALKIYRKRKDEIDLIIMDLIMPGMGGKKCLEKILKIDPNTRVIISSGYSSNGHTKEIFKAGAKGFINKPYDINQMLRVVREILD
ncbi:MAG: PAS domain S-box protein [Thermodesulfobacteriota bacterium]|nr:PAS domain S-box protein [Thermodesulfobacteriota bacterium]